MNAEIVRLLRFTDDNPVTMYAAARIEELECANAVLVAALEPFAVDDAAMHPEVDWDDYPVVLPDDVLVTIQVDYGHVRAARAAIEGKVRYERP